MSNEINKTDSDSESEIKEVTTATEAGEVKTLAVAPDTIDKTIAQVKKKRKRKVNYLNNKDMMIQVIESHKNGRMTNELAKMLTLLTQRYGSRSNFAGYSYNEDMQAYALMMLCRTWSNFNPEKYNNPFAYYTQCIKNNFRQYLVMEKKHRNIRDKLLVSHGMTPSHTYQIENEGGSDFHAFQFDELPEHNEYDESYD